MKPDFIKALSFTRRGAAVKRCHALPTLRENTVGQHTFNAVWLARLLLGGTPEFGLLNLCTATLLAHDLAECVVGDVPAPTKRHLDSKSPGTLEAMESEVLRINLGSYAPGIAGMAAPSTVAALVCKFSDVAELALFCKEERALGNASTALADCLSNCVSYMLALMTEPATTKCSENLTHNLNTLLAEIEDERCNTL